MPFIEVEESEFGFWDEIFQVMEKHGYWWESLTKVIRHKNIESVDTSNQETIVQKTDNAKAILSQVSLDSTSTIIDKISEVREHHSNCFSEMMKEKAQQEKKAKELADASKKLVTESTLTVETLKQEIQNLQKSIERLLTNINSTQKKHQGNSQELSKTNIQLTHALECIKSCQNQSKGLEKQLMQTEEMDHTSLPQLQTKYIELKNKHNKLLKEFKKVSLESSVNLKQAEKWRCGSLHNEDVFEEQTGSPVIRSANSFVL